MWREEAAQHLQGWHSITDDLGRHQQGRSQERPRRAPEPEAKDECDENDDGVEGEAPSENVRRDEIGLDASDSAGSQLSRFFTGTPTDKSMWLLIGGAAAVTVGAITTFRNSGKA